MPNGHGFSFPYGVPLVVYPLLAVALAGSQATWWRALLTLASGALAVAFTWEGLSTKEYRAIADKDPTLNRLTWRINWLLFFAAPAWLLALLGVGSLLSRR